LHVALALLALASPVDSLHVGASEKDVAEGMKRSGASVAWVGSAEPQALRRALIESGLLEAINRSGAAPKRKDGGFDFAAFRRFAFAKSGNASWVAALSQEGLRFLLSVQRVPVDQTKDREGWSGARLHRLQSALAALAPYELQPLAKDRWGNSFQWKGKKGRDRIAVWFVPERDELRVLMY
jgi:hypothetical protein